MLVVYGALLAAIGGPARIHGPVWGMCLVWICAQATGYLVSRVSTLALLNDETHYLHDNLPRMALTTICTIIIEPQTATWCRA